MYSHTLAKFTGTLSTQQETQFVWKQWLYGQCAQCQIEHFQVRDLAREIVWCSWARHFTLTVPLSNQVHKWVPKMLRDRHEKLDQHPVQGGSKNTPSRIMQKRKICTCKCNLFTATEDKHLFHWLLVLHADFILIFVHYKKQFPMYRQTELKAQEYCLKF